MDFYYDKCAWCVNVKNTDNYECKNCSICGYFIHGCMSHRIWMTLEEYQSNNAIKRELTDRKEGDLLVCGSCVYKKRQYKDKNGKDIPVDENGMVLEDQLCTGCKKPCKGYIWQSGRMRFDCNDCFQSLTS